MMNAPIILTIIKAEYLDGYRIKAVFNNGVTKVIAFSAIIANGKGLCKKLANLDYFKSFQLDPFTIDWSNEIGFAPEYLYEQGQTEA